MRIIPEVIEDIKSILNNIERTEECTGETLVDINELADEILTINCYTDKPITNADRIRQMTDEELAEFLANFKNTFGEEYEGEMSCLEWLKDEVEEE